MTIELGVYPHGLLAKQPTTHPERGWSASITGEYLSSQPFNYHECSRMGLCVRNFGVNYSIVDYFFLD